MRTKQRLGGQWEVFFVATGDAARRPLAAAKACVRQYMTDARAAFCYAFDSDQALDAAGIDPDRGGMRRLCWTARWGHALSGDEDGSAGGPSDVGCP